jgi:hypothetical protein
MMPTSIQMMPVPPTIAKTTSKSKADEGGNTNAQPVLDKATEDQTDRILYKIEASIEKFRQLAETIQTVSMHHEALLLQRLTIPSASMQTMVASIHAAAAAATSAAIAQERGGRLYGATSRNTFSNDQRTKLQTWYYMYPRPLADELELMAQILSYPPYLQDDHSYRASDESDVWSPPMSVHPQHVRDWFKRRRFREHMRHVMQSVETGVPLHEAEKNVKARLETRIQVLRETVNPDELVISSF